MTLMTLWHFGPILDKLLYLSHSSHRVTFPFLFHYITKKGIKDWPLHLWSYIIKSTNKFQLFSIMKCNKYIVYYFKYSWKQALSSCRKNGKYYTAKAFQISEMCPFTLPSGPGFLVFKRCIQKISRKNDCIQNYKNRKQCTCSYNNDMFFTICQIQYFKELQHIYV